jgi:hypothetical protein
MSQRSKKSTKSQKSQESKNSQKSQTSEKSQNSSTSRTTNQAPIDSNKMPLPMSKRQISTSPKVPPHRIPQNSRTDDVSEVSGSVSKSNELKNAQRRIERPEEELRQAHRANLGPTAHIDLAHVDIVTNGIALTTSPVMFKVEDSAWWRYSGDMMRLVEILDVTPPTPIHPQPYYFVRCQNGQTHSVSHTDLFYREKEQQR